jgi:hypothetical protein
MASVPNSSRAPVPPLVSSPRQLDLPLGDERRPPHQRATSARRAHRGG